MTTVTLSLAKGQQLSVPDFPDSRPLHGLEVAPDEPQQAPNRVYFYRMGWNQCRDAVLAALAFASESSAEPNKAYVEEVSMLKSRVTACLQDPMYANHAEISKTTLHRLLTLISGEFE